MRTRSRPTTVTFRSQEFLYDGGPVHIGQIWTWSKQGSEVITDDPMPSYADKPCEHDVLRISPRSFETWWDDKHVFRNPDGSLSETNDRYVWRGDGFLPDWLDPAAVDPLGTEYGTVFQREYNDFRTAFVFKLLYPFEQRMLLPNFALDLLNLKKDAIHIVDWLKCIRKGFLRKLLRKNPSATLSDLWLKYHFGLKPLIGDMRELLSTLDRVRQTIERIERFGGVGVPVSMRRDLIYDPEGGTGEFFHMVPYTGGNIVKLWRYGERREKVSFTGNARVDYDLNNVSGFTNQLYAILHHAGITDPLSVAWEAIPFSFVIDWFVDIADFLKRHCFLRPNLNPVVTRFTTSYKWVLESDVHVSLSHMQRMPFPPEDPQIAWTHNWQRSCVVVRYRYHRDNGESVNDDTGVFNLNMPGLRQLGHAVALSVQRKTRGRRTKYKPLSTRGA